MALKMKKKLSDLRGQSDTLNLLGVFFEEQDKFVEAEHYFTESLAIMKQLGDRQGEGIAQFNIGNTLLYSNQLERAGEKFELSLRLAKTVNDHEGHADALIQLAAVAEHQQNMQRRQTLLAEAAAVLRKNNIPVTGWLQENGF
jgi:tetratricopeptide (TPR) repeat protein